MDNQSFEDRMRELEAAQGHPPETLCDIGIALGPLQSEKAIPALVALKDHTNEDVRFGVVQGLLCQDSEQAIQALIELSSDEVWDVRNWATFGLVLCQSTFDGLIF